MGKTYSIYVSDDELADWIDHQIENNREIHNQSHMFVSAIKNLKDDTEEDPTEFV